MKSTDTYFSRYFFYKLFKHKVLLIVSLIANILALPLMSIIMSSSIEGLYNLISTSTPESRKSYEFETTMKQLLGSSESAFIICVLVFGILAIISIITPTIIMSYNHRRSDSDMYLSLPISTKSRFLADAAVGAIITVLPLILNFLGGLIFIGKGADIISKYEAFTKGLIIPGISKLTILYPYDFFLFAATIGIIVVICTYFSSLFFACCTGRKAESVIFGIVTPVILTAIGYYIACLVIRTGFGILEWRAVEDIPGYFPPFGMLSVGWNRFYNALLNIDYYGVSILQFPLSVIITNIATCVLFFFGAYICTVKRKAENVGKPFAVEVVYKIIITLFVAFAMALIVTNTAYNYSVDIQGAIIAVAIALAIYLVLQLLHYKNIKKLPRFILHFGASAAVFFTAFVLIAFSGGFGITNYIPANDEIESIEVSNIITGIQPENDIIFTDRKDIELITSLHKKCIEEKTGTGYAFGIKYKLKNGETVLRCYIDSSEKHDIKNEVRKGILSSAAAIEQLLPSDEQINEGSNASFILKDDIVSVNSLSIEGLKALINAISLDFEAGTLNEGEAIGGVNFSWVDVNSNTFFGKIYVRENSGNIIKVLKDESNYIEDNSSTFYYDKSKISYDDTIYAVIGDPDYDFQWKSDIDHFLYIRNKDLKNEKVKELMSLIDFGENGNSRYEQPYSARFDEPNLYFDLDCGIKAEDMEKASALIAEIKAEREKSGDTIDFTSFTFY